MGQSAFEYCQRLKEVRLPDSLESIGDDAFSGCDNLEGIVIPAGVKKIGRYVFDYGERLEWIYFLGDAPAFHKRLSWIKPTFRVYYNPEREGFSSPKWKGYVSRVAGPEISVTHARGRLFSDKSVRNFGKATTGGRGNSKIFTITNQGPLDLKKLVITRTGEYKDDFTIPGPVPPSLASGASVRFRVNFKPGGSGGRNAVLHIGSNDPDEGDFEIKVNGTGVDP